MPAFECILKSIQACSYLSFEIHSFFALLCAIFYKIWDYSIGMEIQSNCILRTHLHCKDTWIWMIVLATIHIVRFCNLKVTKNGCICLRLCLSESEQCIPGQWIREIPDFHFKCFRNFYRWNICNIRKRWSWALLFSLLWQDDSG